MTPTFMSQTLAKFLRPRAQPIALPRCSGIHAIADFAQALAQASAMLAAPFPFLTITGRGARPGPRPRSRMRTGPSRVVPVPAGDHGRSAIVVVTLRGSQR